MVRKKKDDAQLTCTALLDAAEQVFFDNGVAKTTLNDIATAAGLTRGAIYWHFTDKADLLQALFARAMLPVDSMLNEMLQATDADPFQTVRTMCVQVLTNLAHSPAQQRVFNIMFHRCERTGPMIAIMENKRAKREECLAQVEKALAKAVVAGRLPPDTDVVLANQVITNFMAGTMSEWLFAPQSFDLGTCAPGMVDMLLAGLQTNPPRLPKATA
jgi:TetR/AcrR family acrAB operon transcriptional repressor